MASTKRTVTLVIATAMLLLTSVFVTAANADARPTKVDKTTTYDRTTTLAVMTYNGGGPSCPDGALGVPGGCYILISRILVLDFDNNWSYVCPTGSIPDPSPLLCRKPVAG